MKLVVLDPVRRGDWLIKASVFDEQILIFLWNESIIQAKCIIFYDEELAHQFIERICNGS